MNLFIAGPGSRPVDVEAASRALEQLLAELPLLDRKAIRTWRAPSGRATIATISHSSSETGGIRYSSLEVARPAVALDEMSRYYVWRLG